VITGQTGYWGYYGATPVTADQADAGSGGSTGLVVGVLVAVVVLGGGAFLVARSRGRSRDERE
jgi:peptide/nickel transport system substrate-binding protein